MHVVLVERDGVIEDTVLADDERPHHETLSPDCAHLHLLTLKRRA